MDTFCTNLSAYIPRELHERMWEIARSHDRTLSAEVRRALRRYLTEMEQENAA